MPSASWAAAPSPSLMNHQNGTQYFSMAWEHLRCPDIVQGLVKPLFFGFIIASIGCFYGMRTTGGTQGVGRSTIQAVVTASVLIIFVDFLITHVLLSMFGHDERFRHSHRARSASGDTLPVVELRHVTIAFDGPPVLDDSSFTVAPGETRILLGPAGVGKSVLLKLINGLLQPDTGSVASVRRRNLLACTEEKLFRSARPHRHGLSGRRTV